MKTDKIENYCSGGGAKFRKINLAFSSYLIIDFNTYIHICGGRRYRTEKGFMKMRKRNLKGEL